MNLITFYTAATLLSLLVSCSFVKQERSTKLKSCLRLAIENLFGNDAVLYFAYVDKLYHDTPFDVPNPKVILNFDETGVVDFEKRGGKSYVAAWDYHRKPHIFDLINRNSLWNSNETTSRKQLIVIKTLNQLYSVYELLISWGIIYTILVYYNEKYDDDPIIISVNPHGPEGKCRSIPPLYYPHQPCDAGMNLNRTIPQHLGSYNKCPIGYYGMIFDPRTDRVSSVVSETLDSLENVINATIIRNQTESLQHHFVNIRLLYKTQTTFGNYLSATMLQSKLLWLVPRPKQVLGLRVFSKVFKWATWLLIVCAFVATVSIWAIILFRRSRSEDLIKIIFDALSLTIYGLMRSMPQVSLLRFVILIYILSFINIQTAFICKLIPVLTVPIYERSIETLEELVDSGYLIYTTKDIKDVYFQRTESSDTLYSHIKEHLQVCDEHFDDCLRMLMLYNNMSVLVPAYILENWQTNNGFTFHYVIINDKVVENIQLTFTALLNYYVMDSANVVIKRLVEGGFYLRRERDIDEYHRKSAELREPSKDPVALNLSHVYGIFIIYGFGISIAVLVFILEVSVGRFSKFKGKVAADASSPRRQFLS